MLDKVDCRQDNARERQSSGADGATTPATATTVAEIVSGRRDCRGELIDYVYFKREQYAIYLSGTQVVVAYSDNNQIADEQIKDASPLLPLRDHLTNIIKDLPKSGTRSNYLAQIAEGLRLSLEEQLEVAKTIIGDAITDALNAQARIGRLVYLKCAGGLSFLLAAGLILGGGTQIHDDGGVHLLLMATGAGAIGAFLSIAIAIRRRSVAIDGNWQANAMDAAVRVLIGVISAAILFLVLNSGLLTDLQVGAIKFSGDKVGWQAVLVVGVIAGFLERLVPDLLESSTGQNANSASPPPTSSSGVATPSLLNPGSG